MSIFVNSKKMITEMNIVPQKIRLARKMRYLSMDGLVALMGQDAVSKMAISKIERGLLRPSDRTLQAIARACSVPASYFYTPVVATSRMEFRFDRTTPPRQREQIEASVLAAIESHVALHSYNLEDEPFVNPLADMDVSNYPDIDVAAERLRRAWEIGRQPIFSVYELLQNHGIHVIEMDIDDERVDGASTFVNGTLPVVVVNRRHSNTTERKRFTALHELGHLLLSIHPLTEDAYAGYRQTLTPIDRMSTVKCPDAERLCHHFAGAMLLPEASLRRRMGGHRTHVAVEELISLRNTYGISISAAVHQLHDLCLIDDACYNHLYDTVINPNRMEEGLGSFPIPEVADADEMIKVRLEKELYDE